MIFFGVLLFSVCSVSSFNTFDVHTISLSDLLRRLNDLEQRLQVQERINEDQKTTIKQLIVENRKFKKYRMPETEQSVYIKMQHENRKLNKTDTVEKIISPYKVPFSNSNLKSKISDEDLDLTPENCCQKSLLNFRNEKPTRRSVTGGVAFYSYLSHDEDSLGHHQTSIFDNIITNVGGNYNRHTGIFSCPVNGVYTFSWTLFCSSSGYFISEIVVNSNAVGAVYCNAQGATNLRHTTGVVIVEINQGDAVYIRTHSTHSISGILLSSSYDRSSFSGWKLF